MTSNDELEARALFEQRYGITAAPPLGEIERREPPGAFQQRLADRRSMLAAIDAGLLGRSLVVAWRKAKGAQRAGGWAAA